MTTKMKNQDWKLKGGIHYEFLQHGRTITADIYCQQLDRALCRKYPDLIKSEGFTSPV